MMQTPEKLRSKVLEKIWGTPDTRPWYDSQGLRVGEVWFLNQDGSLPSILIKFLFTSDRLSVQVHPDDETARRLHDSPGKTEMWHILRAAPGATLGLGLKQAVDPERLRAASLSGEIEDLVNWMPVRPGDTVLVPARTIHAIGAGLALCEIQQPSDITYRLYDYGRPRPLQIEESLAVAIVGPPPQQPTPEPVDDITTRLVSCPHFITDRLSIESAVDYKPASSKEEFLIVLQGEGEFSKEPYGPGSVWRVPAGTNAVPITPRDGTVLLRTRLP